MFRAIGAVRCTASVVTAVAALTLTGGCSANLSATSSQRTTAATQAAPTTTAEPVTTTVKPTTTTGKTTRTTTAAAVTAPPTAPITAAPDPSRPIDARDWDGVRWDFGVIVGATDDSGEQTIQFDRYQLVGDPDPIDPQDYSEEPIVFGNTDAPFLNDNPKIRSYTLMPDVVVLRMADSSIDDACNFDTGGSTVADYVEVNLAELQALPGWVTVAQTSLTFTDRGGVELIRLSYGC